MPPSNVSMDAAMFLYTTGISEQLYPAQYVDRFVFEECFKCFYLPQTIRYDAFCDDFGPMNMSCIVDIVRLLDTLLVEWVDRKLVLCIDIGRHSLINAVFLIGLT